MSIFLRHKNHDLKNLSHRPEISFRLPIVLKKASPSSEETKIPRLKKCLSDFKEGLRDHFFFVHFLSFFHLDQDSKKLGDHPIAIFRLRVVFGYNGPQLEGNRNRTTEKSDTGYKFNQHLAESLD